MVPQINPRQLARHLANDRPVLLVDVRQPWEHEAAGSRSLLTNSGGNSAMTPRSHTALSAEALEDRLTPSTSSTLLPAFYADLLHRAPDPGSGGYAAQLNAGVRPASVAFQIETA